MKKRIVGIIAIAVLLIIIGIIFLLLRGNEDNWIKDSKGVWIKHGNPSNTPTEVLTQEEAIKCASNLYEIAKFNRLSFNSQCLGTCKDYAVDIVNVPRSEDDNKLENQCADFRSGKVSHFIELDKNGEIVRLI